MIKFGRKGDLMIIFLDMNKMRIRIPAVGYIYQIKIMMRGKLTSGSSKTVSRFHTRVLSSPTLLIIMIMAMIIIMIIVNL